MAVHVWSKDGDCVGQIAEGGHDKLGVSDANNKELMRALNALLGRPPMSDSGGLKVRFANQRPRFLEFPNEDWLDVAAILILAACGVPCSRDPSGEPRHGVEPNPLQ